jgi:hypothetical protein
VRLYRQALIRAEAEGGFHWVKVLGRSLEKQMDRESGPGSRRP